MSAKQTTMPTPRPSDLNPLIAYEIGDEETVINVRGALTFIADALNSMGGNNLPQESAEGVSRLILCCVAALEVAKA